MATDYDEMKYYDPTDKDDLVEGFSVNKASTIPVGEQETANEPKNAVDSFLTLILHIMPLRND